MINVPMDQVIYRYDVSAFVCAQSGAADGEQGMPNPDCPKCFWGN